MSALVTLASHTGRLEMPNTVMRTESLRLQQAWDQLPSIHSRYIHSYEFLPRSFNVTALRREARRGPRVREKPIVGLRFLRGGQRL